MQGHAVKLYQVLKTYKKGPHFCLMEQNSHQSPCLAAVCVSVYLWHQFLINCVPLLNCKRETFKLLKLLNTRCRPVGSPEDLVYVLCFGYLIWGLLWLSVPLHLHLQSLIVTSWTMCFLTQIITEDNSTDKGGTPNSKTVTSTSTSEKPEKKSMHCLLGFCLFQ